ncbi:MAG: beta-ribofuranosylaminobenzene 5'-phosphate synthase family protein [Halobacteriaceae archaeon]
MARVTTGARVHVGFCNLSLAHERLYGGIGVALEAPRTVVRADPADAVTCEDDDARAYAETACDLLGVEGAEVTVEESLGRHVGLGSGTQLALATLAAVATAHDREPRARERAPALGRGGRSGVGVAAFEAGGTVLDAGHPTGRFTADEPAAGEWEVPPVAARHDTPADWRFVLVRPEAAAGRHGAEEERSIRRAVGAADPEPADRIAGVVLRRLLPAVAGGDHERFGAAVQEVGRLNGAWYVGEQGGVYRPPAGDIVEALAGDAAIAGAGQSSWGPTVFGVTDAGRADAARRAGERALDAAGVDGDVLVAAPRNRGASVEN